MSTVLITGCIYLERCSTHYWMAGSKMYTQRRGNKPRSPDLRHSTEVKSSHMCRRILNLGRDNSTHTRGMYAEKIYGTRCALRHFCRDSARTNSKVLLHLLTPTRSNRVVIYGTCPGRVDVLYQTAFLKTHIPPFITRRRPRRIAEACAGVNILLTLVHLCLRLK